MTKRKIWITVAICVAVALLIGLAIGGMRLWRSGHGGETDEPAGTTAPATTEATGDSTTGETGEPDTSEPEVTEPEATGTTEPGSTTPEATEPGAPETTEPDTDSTDPTASTEAVPEPTEAVTDPGEAATTEVATPDPTDPEPTDPPATKPAATEATSKPTTAKPAATEATKHVHKYSKKVVKPTCTKKGYTKYTCSCGETYKDDYVAATGHDYKTKTVKATCQSKGYTKYTCSTCGDSYKDNYTAKGGHDYKFICTSEPSIFDEGYDLYYCKVCGYELRKNTVPQLDKDEWQQKAAEATVKWINYYRKQQGDTEATILPGLTLVAEYRANQLTTNFAHSTKDLREAYAYYDYGEWVDGSKWGIDSYYTANAKEAIADCGTAYVCGSDALDDDTIDRFGKSVAEQFLESSGHWDYVGDSEWIYIGVGVATKAGNGVQACVLLTKINYG